MNAVYICTSDLSDNGLIGVNKKVNCQVNEFKKRGYNTYLIYIDKFKCNIISDKNNKNQKFFYKSNKEVYNFIIKICKDLSPLFIYIRKEFIIDYFVFEFYKNLRVICNNSKIIIEFPTIPYDAEIKDKTALKIDRFYRNEIFNFFDFSINFNNLNNIFKIKSIPIKNGISLDNIPIKRNIEKNEKNINLIAVADLLEAHGFERIIIGLKNYYFNEFHKVGYKITFNIVGQGNSEVFNFLHVLSKEYKIDEYINFTGILVGDKLDDIFNKSDIAIAALGFYKIGLSCGSPLKTKEYCARGIPFIIAYNDLSFDINSKYILKFPNDNSPVSILTIINFYDNLKKYPSLSYEMRKYAEDNLTWTKCFEDVFKAIEDI